MKLRMIALSIGLLFAQAHLVGMNKIKYATKLFTKKNTQALNVFYSTSKVQHKKICKFEDEGPVFDKKNFDMPDCDSKLLKLIESERNKIFKDIALGKLIDFGSGTHQERGPLEQWKELFARVIEYRCGLCANNKDLLFSFEYFNADELIKLLDACICQKKE